MSRCEVAHRRKSSTKIGRALAELFPGSIHVANAALTGSPDVDVWEYAKANEFTILTADADFFVLATTLGPPPKVIWLRRWTHPTRDAENVLRREAIRIVQFERDAEVGLLVIDKA
jgi:predicted nuclease of predicted toxin-antitoxin system